MFTKRHLFGFATIGLLLLVLRAIGLGGQVAIGGQGSIASPPVPTTQPVNGQVGPTGVLTANDFVFLGAIRLDVSQLADLPVYGMFTVRKVGGVRHFIVTHSTNEAFSPIEFADTNPTYDANGNCTSAPSTCYQPNYLNAPLATLVADYAPNAPIIIPPSHDAWRNKEGAFQNNLGAVHSCFDGTNNCLPGAMRWHDDASAPQGGGYLYLTLGSAYSAYEEGLQLNIPDPARPGCETPNTCQAQQLVADTLNSAAATTVTYGPWRVFSNATVANNGAPGSGSGYGIQRAEYLLELPDGSFGHGGAHPAGYQQGGMPDGPTLFGGGGAASWPTSTTPASAYGQSIGGSDKYLNYYAQETFTPAQGNPPLCVSQVVPTANIVGFHKPNYAYVFETGQGACMSIDPSRNNGVGTWGEVDYVKSMEWITLPTKRGVIAFTWQGSNHLSGNTAACTDSHGNPQHGIYQQGPGPCVYSGVPNGGSECDHHCCPAVFNTGPTYSHMEPVWVVYDPNDLIDVKNGHKTDYTVDANNRIYPLDQPSWTINWPGNGGGTVSNLTFAIGGTYFDPVSHILFICVRIGDQFTYDLIYAFLIKG